MQPVSTDPDVKISLIRFLGSGPFTEPSTTQATPRVAHNFAALQTFRYYGQFWVTATDIFPEAHRTILCLYGSSGLASGARLSPHTQRQLPVLCSCLALHSIGKIRAVCCTILHAALSSDHADSPCTIATASS